MQVVFEYLDAVGQLFEKSMPLSTLAQLEVSFPKLLARLELLLPAWELDINRHMMLHLVSRIRGSGPCWVWSMFGFERLWGRLIRWMSQKTHPEATMLNAFMALKTASAALPADLAGVQQDEEDAAHGGAAITPFTSPLNTFDRGTFKLKLPSFLQPNSSRRIVLSDNQEDLQFGDQRPDVSQLQAQLHQFYLTWPGYCTCCDCEDPASCACPDYQQMWEQFMAGRPVPYRADLPDLIYNWHMHAGDSSKLLVN